MKGRVLIVDDDAAIRRAVRDRLRHWGLTVDAASDGKEGLSCASKAVYDVVLLDLSMPEMDGMEVLERLKSAGCEAEVVVLTAHGSVDRAVHAVRAGAADFLEKPTDFTLLRARMHNLLEKRRRGRLVRALETLAANGAAAPIVAESEAMRGVLDTAAKAADSDVNVLVTGESGTGKQVVAEFVHATSRRAAGPFVYVNCVSLSDDLAESTLFGHEQGAFTGAVARKEGRLELAEGGTAFLDEIGDASPRIQTKLLHFLESGEYERVGGTRTLRADCRIVTATNRDLQPAIDAGDFRKDLYYRINVVHLHLPPLRERRDDIEPLARRFVARFAREAARQSLELPAPTVSLLRAHDWPGNVRELRNVVERMVVLAPEDGRLHPGLLPVEIRSGTKEERAAGAELDYRQSIRAFKRSLLARALERSDGNQTRAASLLGIQRSFLNRMMRELELRED